jgi:hypothetical protein
MSDGYNIDQPVQVLIEGETPPHSTRRSGGGDEEAARARADAARWQRQAEINGNAAVENARIAWTNAADAAAQEYAAAAETGDFKKQGEAQRKVAAAEARLAILEGNQAPSHSGRVQSQPISTGNAVDDFCARLSPASADWVRQNPDVVSDPKLHSRMLAGHYDAVGEGIPLDTPEYFRHVEAKLNRSNGGNGSGSGSSRSGGGKETVALSRGEIERSEDGSLVFNAGERDAQGKVIERGDPRIGKPIGRQTLAYRKLQMQRQGYYNRPSS